MAKFNRLNDQIRSATVRVIDTDGKQLGILSRQEALDLAREKELDLVELSPNANPPVCKIIDWGKYNYQRTKQQQKSKKNAKALDLKQIRVGLKISQHDLETKMNQAAKFLEAGHKVKISMMYRGREQAHREIGFELAKNVIEEFSDTIVVDQQPQLAGKQLTFVIRSSGKKPVKFHQTEGIINAET